MTPAEAREIDRLEFEAEAAAIRRRAYALSDRRPVKATPKPAPKPEARAKCKKPGNRTGRPATLYTVGNVSLPLSQWALRLNTTIGALRQRLRKGWSVWDTVTVPVGRRRPGVVDNLPPFVGTGAGSTAQETTEITFSEEANS